MNWQMAALAALFFGLAPADGSPVANPSFEEGASEQGIPLGWSTRDGIAVKTCTDGGRTGSGYVRFFDDDASKGQMLECQRIAARPGGSYTAAAWLRTARKCAPGVYLNFYDQFGTRIAHKYERAAGPTDGWTRVEVADTAPDQAWEVSAAVYAYVGDTGEFDADDVELVVQGGQAPGSAGVERAQHGEKGAADIGDRLELFVDSFLIDGMSGKVQRRLHHPIPREIILRLDKPWEGYTSAYFVVFKDGHRIRMYYRGSDEKDQFCCLAESEDGVRFERLALNLFEFRDALGNKADNNNIVWRGMGAHNFTPFKDPNPDAPEDQRYKAVGYSDHGRGLAGYVSADGVRWRELREAPIITDGAFDSQNLVFWDPLRRLYVDFHRKGREGVRDIMTCTSEDFANWTDPVFVEYADERKEHMYTNGIQPYFRAPHIYIGLPARFVPGRKKVAEHPHSGVSDAVLMSSRDGLRFERWEEGFIRPRPEPEVWTDRNNYPAWGMLQTAPDEISLYWTEHYRHPTMRLRRGVIRTDGFVSVHAGGEPGEIVTRPLVFSGDHLVANYATSAVGWIRFELCHENGEPIEGYSLVDSEMLFGNEIEHTATWGDRTGVGELAGRPVRLRVQLHDADLYSFQFVKGADR